MPFSVLAKDALRRADGVIAIGVGTAEDLLTVDLARDRNLLISTRVGGTSPLIRAVAIQLAMQEAELAVFELRASAHSADQRRQLEDLRDLYYYAEPLHDVPALATYLRRLRADVEQHLADGGAADKPRVLLLDGNLLQLLDRWPDDSPARADLRFVMEYGAEARAHVIATVPFGWLRGASATSPVRISELLHTYHRARIGNVFGAAVLLTQLRDGVGVGLAVRSERSVPARFPHARPVDTATFAHRHRPGPPTPPPF